MKTVKEQWRLYFRDKTMTRYTIDIELKESDESLCAYDTLEPISKPLTLSISGSGGLCSGQIFNYIQPRTVGQKKLIALWKTYHNNDMKAGTRDQEYVLHSNAGIENMRRLIDAYKATEGSDEERIQAVYNIASLKRLLILTDNNKKHLRDVVRFTKRQSPRDLDSMGYTMDRIILILNGILTDRDYTYGRKWLILPLPEDITTQIEITMNDIIREETIMTGNKIIDFSTISTITDDQRAMICKKLSCDEAMADRYAAIGMFIGCSLSDMIGTSSGDRESCSFKIMGNYYVAGTDEELTERAQEVVLDKDNGYLDLWKDEIYAGQTLLGFEEWAQYILDSDGWLPILNHYDNVSEAYHLPGGCICVSKEW